MLALFATALDLRARPPGARHPRRDVDVEKYPDNGERDSEIAHDLVVRCELYPKATSCPVTTA